MIKEKSRTEALNPSVLKEFARQQKNTNEYFELINNRFHTVFVQGILSFFKSKLSWYDYDNGYDGQDGHFSPVLYEDFIGVTGEFTCRSKMVIIDKDGNEIDLSEGFPTRWLNENFTEELKNGRKKYLEKEAAEKDKVADAVTARREKRLGLCSSIRRKLSKEEIKFIMTKLNAEEKKELNRSTK